MSRLWPHTPYAEDQPFSRSILTTHVLTRAIQTGSLIGGLVSFDLYLLPRVARYFNVLPSLQKRIPTASFPRLFLRSSGVGTVAGLGIGARVGGQWAGEAWLVVLD
ncbi:hypothetical protein D0Z07_7573 [Hyphodiscus hymeniophilus]|uniref:Uncharacterized protein n=1 Tax=Hyphodiscus hymeniophilus TaxID=353542 RepID=A0A9P6VEN6_9HELO|nr:hypothetical protein D0Z07_7573 [Hyphodiscus hymeniophilus]